MKLRLLASLLLFFMLVHLNYGSTTGKISGLVKDAKTGEELIGVNVIIEGTSLGAATDIDGRYTILNVPPGNYSVVASMVGYTKSKTIDVRVNIDQTTVVDFQLTDQTLETSEVVVIAKTPIVQKDVSSSGVNLNVREIENLPVIDVQSVVGLQAGIEGESIRGGSSNETAFLLNGVSMKDGRDNTPYSGVSFTSIDQIQIKTGGFNAEFGDIRSGLINVVTKEGDKNKYSFSFISRYSPTDQKHFGHSPHSFDSYYIRPFVDPAVAFVGTENGAWDEFTQKQYPTFEGWNVIAERTLQNDNPNDDLTPEAARDLFLWQHRRNLDIDEGDYDFDMSFGGPVPVYSQELGNLRFFASYRKTSEMYVVPLSRDRYLDESFSMKFTSDIMTGMKLMVEGLYGIERGTNTSFYGYPGIFRSPYSIASSISQASFLDTRLFVEGYWAPTEVIRNSLAAKLTHVINPSTFYEVTLNSFASDYSTNPGRVRDTSPIRKFGNNYWVDEAPFGFFDGSSDGIDGMFMGAPMSTSRDSSYVRYYKLKFDITSQLDNYNNLKAGFEVQYTHNQTSFGRFSAERTTSNIYNRWTTFPIQASLYIQDKLEFEAMVANIGFRIDYSDPNGNWWVYDPYDAAFAAENFANRSDLLQKTQLDGKFTISPRLGVAFPITENSKLFFNYGHFRTLPTPEHLFRIENDYTGSLNVIANPQADFPKTVAYELGYEQNLLDQFLLRLTGYYKDVSNESRTIQYLSRDGKVSYSKSEPIQYSDIRGFEATITKNRGQWVQGFLNYTYMVSTSGRFGWGRYYQSPTEQRDYERTSTWHYQARPIPRPYARANVDFFTPQEFGPKLSSFYPLENLRLNILASWKAGSYYTWTGGSAIGGIVNNVQFKDYFNVNLRLSKDFEFGPIGMQIFVQLDNVFNTKRLSFTGFTDKNDHDSYFKSLHLPVSAIQGNFGYVNIPGDDQPGDYRKNGADFIPILAVNDVTTVSQNDLRLGTIYYDAASGQFMQNDGNGWNKVDQSKMDKILEDKAYIDMPNQGFFSFLGNRDIYFGLKLNFAL